MIIHEIVSYTDNYLFSSASLSHSLITNEVAQCDRRDSSYLITDLVNSECKLNFLPQSKMTDRNRLFKVVDG
jgi:hypothetical protein